LDWKDFLNSADLLLKDLSSQGNKAFNNNLNLKLDTYYFIFDCIDPKILSVSEDLPKVLGYQSEDFTIHLFFNSIHPEDKDIFMRHEQEALNFCLKLPLGKQKNYKIVHDYRLKKKDGTYIRVLQQTVAYEINESCVLKTIIQHTDISTIKTSGESELHFIDLVGNDSVYKVQVSCLNTNLQHIQFTKREKDILKLLDKAWTSEKIAEKLFISVHTVRTHRKNLLKKIGCDNTIELLKLVKSLNVL